MRSRKEKISSPGFVDSFLASIVLPRSPARFQPVQVKPPRASSRLAVVRETTSLLQPANKAREEDHTSGNDRFYRSYSPRRRFLLLPAPFSPVRALLCFVGRPHGRFRRGGSWGRRRIGSGEERVCLGGNRDGGALVWHRSRRSDGDDGAVKGSLMRRGGKREEGRGVGADRSVAQTRLLDKAVDLPARTVDVALLFKSKGRRQSGERFFLSFPSLDAASNASQNSGRSTGGLCRPRPARTAIRSL
jgi:hypothetical protein